MALSIETEEASRLAREREWSATLEARSAAIERAAENVRRHLTDLRPVTKEEWDEASGDTD